jgi:E3 ubiquitin-protein ligase SHPRH
MRVCVYQGWQSLQKAIKRQRDSNIRAVTEALENKKRKSSASFRARTVKKYKMLNGDASVKQEVEEAVVDDPEVEDVSSLEICQRQFVEYVRAHDVVLATYK